MAHNHHNSEKHKSHLFINPRIISRAVQGRLHQEQITSAPANVLLFISALRVCVCVCVCTRFYSEGLCYRYSPAQVSIISCLSVVCVKHLIQFMISDIHCEECACACTVHAMCSIAKRSTVTITQTHTHTTCNGYV